MLPCTCPLYIDTSEVDLDRLKVLGGESVDDDELLPAPHPGEHDVQEAWGEGGPDVDDDIALDGGALTAVPCHAVGLQWIDRQLHIWLKCE